MFSLSHSSCYGLCHSFTRCQKRLQLRTENLPGVKFHDLTGRNHSAHAGRARLEVGIHQPGWGLLKMRPGETKVITLRLNHGHKFTPDEIAKSKDAAIIIEAYGPTEFLLVA